MDPMELDSLYLHNKLFNSLLTLNESKFSKQSNNSLRFLHHNCRSILNKMYFFQSLNLCNTVDIFSVSETWLKPQTPNSLLHLHNFNKRLSITIGHSLLHPFISLQMLTIRVLLLHYLLFSHYPLYLLLILYC